VPTVEGLGGLGELGQAGGDRVPGQLLEHRLAAAVGQPAAEVPDGLAVQLDRPRRLRGGAQMPLEGRQQVLETDRHGGRSSGEEALCQVPDSAKARPSRDRPGSVRLR
jgi:hypothetical protein